MQGFIPYSQFRGIAHIPCVLQDKASPLDFGSLFQCRTVQWLCVTVFQLPLAVLTHSAWRPAGLYSHECQLLDTETLTRTGHPKKNLKMEEESCFIKAD